MRRSRWLDPAAESVVIATSVDLGNFWRIGMVCVLKVINGFDPRPLADMKRSRFYFSLMAAFFSGIALCFYFWIWGTGHPPIRGMSNVSRPWDMTCGHVSGHVPRFVSTQFHILFLLPIRTTPIFTAAFNRRMTVLAEQLFRSFSAVVMAAVDTSPPKFAATNSRTLPQLRRSG